jgi:hypothetical protein
MRKRRLAILDGVVLLVTVAVGLPVLQLSTPKTPLRQKYDRIRVGMTAEEVHAIMGRPDPMRSIDWPSHALHVYGDNAGDLQVRSPPGIPPRSREAAQVEFASGRVICKAYSDGDEPSRLERWLAPIRQGLGW